MDDELESVAVALEQVRALLLTYGDRMTAPRLVEVVERLRRGDESAIITAISEATGGMGSLHDRYLCEQNGDAIDAEDVEPVNILLGQLVADIEARARLAAAKRGVRLDR
jgi:hypothetical protein